MVNPWVTKPHAFEPSPATDLAAICIRCGSTQYVKVHYAALEADLAATRDKLRQAEGREQNLEVLSRHLRSALEMEQNSHAQAQARIAALETELRWGHMRLTECVEHADPSLPIRDRISWKIERMSHREQESQAIINAIGFEKDELRAKASAAEARAAEANHRATRIAVDAALEAKLKQAQARIAALEKELDDYKSTGPYEAKALDLVAETLATLSASDWEARGPKLWAVVRNGAEWCRRFEARIAALEQRIRDLPNPIEAVTAGANPQKGGGMSSPLWHCACRWCEARWSFTSWKRDALMTHPENGCLWAELHHAQADARGREEER